MSQMSTLSRDPTHKSKAKTQAATAAVALVKSAPADLVKTPVWRTAKSIWARADLVAAWAAAQAGDARLWREAVTRHGGGGYGQ